MDSEASRTATIPRSQFPITRSPFVALDGSAHFGEVFFWTRQTCRKKSRDAICQFAAPNNIERLIRRIAEVASPASVGMNVHKSRKKRTPSSVNTLFTGLSYKIAADLGNAPLRNAD